MNSLLYIILALIMFATGNSINFDEFKKPFYKPKALLFGLGMQVIALPLLTFILVNLIDIPVAFKIGFLLLSICPGGTTSNFISYLINANVALSIGLTSINSLLILLTIPILTNLFLTYFIGENGIEISILNTFIQVLFIVIIPALLGAWLRHKKESISERIKQPFKIINVILLASFYSYKFTVSKSSGGVTTEDIINILPYAILLNMATMLFSYLFTKKIGLVNIDSVTIAIEVGLQNTGLAILIATNMIGNHDMAKPALIFAMFSFFTALLFGIITKKLK